MGIEKVAAMATVTRVASLFNGEVINACLMMMGVAAQGQQLTTIEGVASADGSHPLQQQCLEHAALQCAFAHRALLLAACRICWRIFYLRVSDILRVSGFCHLQLVKG